jgi:hypothetical protein
MLPETEQPKPWIGEVKIGDRLIKYNDCVHHETVSVFDWKDRIRILFGRPCRIVSQIYTKEPCNVAGSDAQVYVAPIIKRKPKPMMLQHPGNGVDFGSIK